jgi:hypothetical protein
MNELKPCPFCGGKAHVAKTLRGWKVECQGRMGSCYMNARTHYQPHKFLAVTAWNTRTEIDTLRAEVARLDKIDWREMFLSVHDRMRKAGESKEMGARWFSEAARVALAHREDD